MPREAIPTTWSWTSSAATSEQRDRMTSGAPFSNRTLASPIRCSVAMNWFSLSKGMASSRGDSWRTSEAFMPAFSAAVRSAPSVGSPVTVQRPDSACSEASLHSTPASSRLRPASGRSGVKPPTGS